VLEALEREAPTIGGAVQQRVEPRRVELRLDQPAREDRLHFGCEDEAVGHPREIKGLDPEAVAPRQEQALALVVEEERELTSQMGEAIEPELFVKGEDHL
jgi:hypothetical protein